MADKQRSPGLGPSTRTQFIETVFEPKYTFLRIFKFLQDGSNHGKLELGTFGPGNVAHVGSRFPRSPESPPRGVK